MLVILKIIVLALFLTSCGAGGLAPVNSNRTVVSPAYNSGELAKTWRSQIRKTTPPSYGSYPADNDSDYYYPSNNYGTPPPGYYPPSVPNRRPPANTRPSYPYNNYPTDNDSNYGNAYPRYNPDADNRYPGYRGQPSDSTGNGFGYPLFFE